MSPSFFFHFIHLRRFSLSPHIPPRRMLGGWEGVGKREGSLKLGWLRAFPAARR